MQTTYPTPVYTSDLIDCDNCDGKIARDAADAYDLLFGPYRLEPSSLARELTTYIERNPNADDAQVLDMALWRWFGFDAIALVQAARHRIDEDSREDA